MNRPRRIFLARHRTPMSGPMDYLEEYLRRQGWEAITLAHPLDSYRGRVTALLCDGVEIAAWRRSPRGPLSLLWDFGATVRLARRLRINAASGENNFDTLALLVARRTFPRSKPRVVYFAADFSENRFGNRLLDAIYFAVERAALRGADLVVSNTRRAETKRLSLGLDRARSVVVPNGVLLPSPRFQLKNIRTDRFVFVGSVTREHGLYELIEAIKPLIGQLVIIGHGDDWDRVVDLCIAQRIPHELYHNQPHSFVIEYLQAFDGLGLAPYNLQSRWTYYCSPLKVNEYIACGVPVVMSSVPEIATTIRDRGLGVVYDRVDADTIAIAISGFDPHDFHLKARAFYSDFNSDRLYGQIEF